MKTTSQLNFKDLNAQEDTNLNAILIYGTDCYTGKTRLVVWYSRDKGLEWFYESSEVLDKQQRERVKEIIKDFDPSAEVYL